jgi:D-threo-aldose 1-dehydrogenase
MNLVDILLIHDVDRWTFGDGFEQRSGEAMAGAGSMSFTPMPIARILDALLPFLARRKVSIALGGPFNSGILATGARPGAKYKHENAAPELLDRAPGGKRELRRRHDAVLGAAHSGRRRPQGRLRYGAAGRGRGELRARDPGAR